MAAPYIVNQSTTIVQFDTSDIGLSPHIALLSSVNAPGALITIRDFTGNASATNKIVVSTMMGQSFVNGNNLSSYTITQPYGFLTITPKTTQGWALLNTFGFPDSSTAANINTITSISITTNTFEGENLTVSTAVVSSLLASNIYLQGNISVGQSTIGHAGFFVCTLRTLENMFVGNTVYAGSTLSSIMANITSTLTVPYINATTLDIRGVIKTASTISTNGPLFVGSSISTTGNLAVGGSTFIQGELRVQQNATFYSSISTLYRLDVGRETQLNSTLSVRDDALLYKNLSTVLNLNVGGALSVNSNLNVMGSTILNKTLLTFGEISSLSNVFINRNLSVAGDIAVGGNLNFGPTVRFSNIIASSLLANFFISTPSSIAAGTSLNVLGSTILTGPVSTLSNLNVAGAFNLNGAASLNSTLTVVSSISTTGNLTVSGIISTLSSLSVGDSLNVDNNGVFGNNLSTISSLGVGKHVSIEGTLFVRSSISTIGTAAFYSSVQIQGGVSIFSSLTVAGSTFMQKVGIGGNIPTLASDPSGNSVLKVTGDLQLTGDLRDASGNRISLIKAGDAIVPGINSAGTIGINKASNATYELDVSGDTRITGLGLFVNTSNTGDLGITGNTILNTLQTSGNVGVGAAAGTDRIYINGTQSNLGDINISGNLNVYANSPITGNIYSEFNTTVGSNLVVSLKTTLNGNVGIGKAPTANPLDVSGNAYATKFVGDLSGNATSATYALTPTVGINSAGNVGINKASNATYELDVSGDARISGTLGVTGQTTLTGNVGIGKAPTANPLDVNGNAYATKFVGDLSGNATSATYALTPTVGINSAGNVGINKASNATYELDVSGDARISGTLGVTGQTTLTGNVGIGKAPTANPLDVSGDAIISGNVNLRAAGGGTVTVGASGQTTNMTLYGYIIANNGLRTPDDLIINSDTANKAVTRLVVSNNVVYMMNGFRNSGNILSNGSASDFVFATWGGTPEFMRLTSAGNLGIGTTDPTEKLHVNGNIRIASDIACAGNANLCGNGSTSVFNVGAVGANTVSQFYTDSFYVGRYTDSLAQDGSYDVSRTTYIRAGTDAFNGNGDKYVSGTNLSLSGQKLYWQDGAKLAMAAEIMIEGGRSINAAENGNNHIYFNTNNARRGYFDQTGLNVSGNITASGTITGSSDQRAKENIVTIDSPLDKIMKMRGVYYTRKDIPGPRHIGVIAQEVEEVLPEVVLTDTTENKNKSVAYGNIVALLIEGMKEQQKIIEGQQSTINSFLQLLHGGGVNS